MERCKTIRRFPSPLLVGVLISMLVVVASQSARPEVLVWNFDYPFAAGGIVAMDLGATMTGITEVMIEVEGIGGERRFICYVDPLLESSRPFHGYLFFDKDINTSAIAGEFFLGQLPGPGMPFDGNGPLDASGGWSFLEDGIFTLTVQYDMVEPLPWDYPICIQLGATWPVIAHLMLSITCESVVPNELTAWGAVKVLYR